MNSPKGKGRVMGKEKCEKKLERLLAEFTESLAGEANEPMELSSEEINSLSREMDDVRSLFETIRTISSVIQPKQPSEEFVSKVSEAVQEDFEKQVSTNRIQRVIGMAVTMEDFRKSLFHNVAAACRSIGLSLTPNEIALLRNLKEDVVKEFANSLDERITKFFPTNLP